MAEGATPAGVNLGEGFGRTVVAAGAGVASITGVGFTEKVTGEKEKVMVDME